jgi:hypothetical protein
VQPLFDDVLIFSSEFKTGGPEALHQLGHRIRCHGGTAHIVYHGPSAQIEIDGDVLRCHADASPMPGYFAQYHPQVLREIRPGPDTLIVFPEIWSALAAMSEVRYQRALWWLSLDNALSQNPGLRDAEYRRRVCADPGLVHFYQSDYVRSFLQANGALRYHALSDYTDRDFIHRSLIASENPPIRERADRICFFPNKGAELAAQFIAAQETMQRKIDFVPIREMSKAQVRDTLFNARMYIDFGGHPGKDRVPREAAIAGAIVLLHAAGAARHYLDHPLPTEYLFTEADVASGRLHRQVETILSEPELHWTKQRLYRNAILREEERFDLEVRTFFFTGV